MPARSTPSRLLTIALTAFAAVVWSGLACAQSTSEGAQTAPASARRSAQAAGQVTRTVASIAAPAGFERTPAASGTFASWLRRLSLRPGRPPVKLYNSLLKANQSAHFAIIDIDVGARDLQQCADAVIRLRAEYLFAGRCAGDIRFNFTSGHPARWQDWKDGQRPSVNGSRVVWRAAAPPDGDYRNFRRYLDTVFTYAGSLSLSRELVAVRDPALIEIGDVIIKGGTPGHAVLVVDVAANAAGERVLLLAQSYMPAQDVHILRSPEGTDPWYRARSGGTLHTPEWVFSWQDVRRFTPVDCPPASTS